jgi:hypothetical protein
MKEMNLKIKLLTEGTISYYQINNTNITRDIFSNNYLESFTKIHIRYDHNKKEFTMNKILTDENMLIKLSNIDKTEVSKLMQNVISVHKIYRMLEKMNIDPKIYFTHNQLFTEDIRKKLNGKRKFLFSIKLMNDTKIDFVMLCYSDLKNWLNGLAFLIKNKKRVLNI